MKIIKNCIQIILSSILIGYFLLSMSYAVPINNMKVHIVKYLDKFKQEEIYQQINQYGQSGLLDNFTDSLMISQAISNNGNSYLIQSLENPRIYSDDEDIRNTISRYLNDDNKLNTVNYNRYWHGYLTILKPLLYFTDYYTIRTLNLIIQSILLVIAFILLIKKTNIIFALGFLGSIFVLQPYLISLSLQFSSIYYITLISSIFILASNNLNKNNYIYLFLFIGILTSYFDLLTYPILTFGIPASIYLIINKKDNSIINFIFIGIAWACGYLGMWIGKWIITSLVLNTNIFKIALDTINMRTSTEALSQNISRLQTIKSNYIYGLTKNVVIINAIIFLFNIVYVIIKRYKFKLDINSIVPSIILIIAPAIWFFVTSNHASIHYFYTFRSIAISVFATYVLIFNNYITRSNDE